MLDDPCRVKSQMTSVVCQIQRFDFACNVVAQLRLKPLYTTCTRVQTVSLNPYSCTGEMTPSIQVYTPDGLTRPSTHPTTLHMYSYECRAMCTARPLCSTHYSRYTAVRTVLPGLCTGSELTFYNNEFRVKTRPASCRFGPTAMPMRIRGLNVQPKTVRCNEGCRGGPRGRFRFFSRQWVVHLLEGI
jgi:hypothetical protein